MRARRLGEPEPEDLIYEFFEAFDIRNAPRAAGPPITEREVARRRRLAGVGLPTDPAEYGRLHRSEFEAAEDLLVGLVDRIRTLAPAALGRPEALRQHPKERQQIVDEWNEAIDDYGWRTLPTLCEVCGFPVLLRQPDRLGGDNVDQSTVCSQECRRRRKDRRSSAGYRRRQKLKDASN